MQSATCCYWDKEKDGTAPPPCAAGLSALRAPSDRLCFPLIGHLTVKFDNTQFTEAVGTDAIEAIVTVYFATL